MKKYSFVVLLSFFVSLIPAFLEAAEHPGVLEPASVLKPLPDEYGDEHRLFQGIPSLAIAPGGRIWATWYSGGDTECDLNYILVATSGDDGKTWTKPLFVVDVPGPVRLFDPELWVDPEGKLWLFWAQSLGHWDGRAGVWAMTTGTPDREDADWSAPRRLCDGIMMCKPIVDSKDRWMLPVSIWLWGDHPERTLPKGSSVVASEDKGATWNLLGTAVVARPDANCDEHMIVERKDGSYFMWIRTKYGIAESNSFDGGKTWSEPARRGIPHTASRFFVTRLRSGNILLVKHGAILQPTGRSHLTAMLSDDDGRTWKGELLLDERNGVSYPDGQQAKDGSICIIYDYHRVSDKEILLARFTEEDVLAGKIVSEKGVLRQLINKSTAGPKPVSFEADPNKDGKPFLAGPSPDLEPNDAERGIFKGGVKIFSNREYTLEQYPKELEGKKFICGKLEQIEAVAKSEGMVYVLTPTVKRNKDSVVEQLLKNGFEKVALPETIVFGNSPNNATTLFQKKVKVGETIKFGKWGLLVY